MSAIATAKKIEIKWSKIQGPNLVQIKFDHAPRKGFTENLKISPYVPIESISIKKDLLEIHTQKPFRLDTHYYLALPGGVRRFLQPDGILDNLYSDKPLGCRLKNGKTAFRLFAPRALSVRLILFEKHDDAFGISHPLTRDDDGVWELFTEEDWRGKYYGYRVSGPTGEGEIFDSSTVFADPYSPAILSLNHYSHPAKTVILPKDDFNWEDDTWSQINHKDLIIYEMHVRDMTAHPSSGLPEDQRGNYLGLVQDNQQGGIVHISNLGVNAVELLPVQDFGNLEISFKDSSANIYNTWNPYERNHWGYMTSYFFAPEAYYASGGSLTPGKFNGAGGRQVQEFKEMVKAFHKKGIAVIMDVVYNHVAQYDNNCFKLIDKFYYLRLKPDGNFLSASGCGNDFKTERPMSRRMIIESIKHWMTEYHIDGFRFDLAAMIDRETCKQILAEARKINPNVIIIAEPWGGGKYNPKEFSDMDWASWNDLIRNGFKGWNPKDDRGFIFGEYQGGNNRQTLERYIKGSLQKWGGQYRKVQHSINYLASHDDFTLGDFIRIGLGEVDEQQRITDLEAHVKLTPKQLKLNKLAAMSLLTCQGPVMIHQGQEFARSKVIAKTEYPDDNWGRIDHNSYEKDNETNWLNFDHAEINQELLKYYQGLIKLRKTYRAFRHSKPEDIYFIKTAHPFLLAYRINNQEQSFIVALNGHTRENRFLTLPPGRWARIGDENGIYDPDWKEVYNGGKKVLVRASTGIILKKTDINKS